MRARIEDRLNFRSREDPWVPAVRCAMRVLADLHWTIFWACGEDFCGTPREEAEEHLAMDLAEEERWVLRPVCDSRRTVAVCEGSLGTSSLRRTTKRRGREG
jgi:hypothetical protein